MKIQWVTPVNNSVVPLLTEKHKLFLTHGGNSDKSTQPLDWLNLVRQGEDHSFPEPVVLSWEGTNSGTFFLSESEDFSDAKEIHCESNTVSLENLFLGKTYYCKVVSGNASSDVLTFTTEASAPRWIRAGGLSNIRDIGGWSLPDGKIRQGMVFRGSEMEFHHEIDAHGTDVLLNTLKIKTDLDLRGEAVGKISETALGDSVNWALIPVCAYDEFMKEEEKDACRKIFKLFADEKNYPFYIHCWGGADRTGTLILMLCAILGMSEKDLFLDYELTSFSIWGKRSIESDLFRALLAELDKYGEKETSINQKCENFLLSCGITKDDLAAIRKILIEKGA